MAPVPAELAVRPGVRPLTCAGVGNISLDNDDPLTLIGLTFALLEYELDGRHYETELDHSYQLGSCSDSTLTSDA